MKKKRAPISACERQGTSFIPQEFSKLSHAFSFKKIHVQGFARSLCSFISLLIRTLIIVVVVNYIQTFCSMKLWGFFSHFPLFL